ncbi:MKI67 FHA domain-interacting nucleolar phosphoprotein-like [Pectinophora gossypiella]|uniref:RRM domain-containing protein n=1 Tax=Pectinophora gossypiella TaxID=13191 RepID=A0A1E1W0R9_PECGO|nr:MKI67 FHA domain-interacting nucleolar phosphoprotein-like [Pectinophora gossypiella]
MEENVALDSTKQKKFVKSIKGIKKLIKKKDADPKAKESQGEKVKKGRVGKKKRPERGLVYLAHIPHGFYEHEMTQYFKQFGVVTNARVIKSKRTGRSKGYAFVQFKEPAVAQIVADTMNNYLMGKRLIKASYIEPEKQKQRAFRRHWNSVNNPGNNLRIKMKKKYNENKDEEGELKRAKKLLTNINKTKKKLRELGINYDFFTPVDMPEVLANKKRVKDEESKENVIVNDKKSKKDKKAEAPVVDNKKPVSKESKGKVNKIENKAVQETAKNKAQVTKEHLKTKKSKKLNQNESDKNTQKQKKQNLKDKGVTPLEDFIKVNDDSGDESDSSLDFDSDEYEKMMEQEDDEESEASGDESDEDGADSEEDDEDDEDESDDASDESEVEIQKKKKLVSQQQIKKGGKQKPQQKAVQQKPVQQKILQQKPSQQKMPQSKAPQPQQTKRKAPQNAQSSPKMPKFEKQSNQKPRNKQFKKKK